MKWRLILLNACQALWQHKLRSLLSTLGIVFAVIAVVSMLSIAEGAKRETLEQIRQLGTNSILVRQISMAEMERPAGEERAADRLELRDARLIASHLPELICVAPVVDIPASIKAAEGDRPLEVVAVDPSYQAAKGLVVEEGRFLSDMDVVARKLVCVIGADVVRALGLEGRVGGTLRMEDTAYRIVGILEAGRTARGRISALNIRNHNRMVFIPLGANPVRGNQETVGGTLSEIHVRIAEDAGVSAYAQAIERVLSRTRGGSGNYQIVMPRELLRQAQHTQRIFNFVLGSIAGISLLVGGIGIMNIMLAGVSERIKEIGIRRSVGANRAHIVAHFLCESTLLTVWGGLAGLLLGFAASVIVSRYAGWPTVVTPWSMGLSLLMACGVGILSGLYPAVKAAWIDPVAALRYE